MTAIEAYILAKRIALGAVSGIANITFNDATSQIIFHFNDGSSAGLYVPVPKDGKDGLSIVDVEIDNNKHLICTMSDGSTIDAGEIPGGTGGGLVQVKNKNSLPAAGEDNTLYLTQDDDILYYWDDKDKIYRPVTGGSGANGVDFKTSSDIIFDGVETVFDAPIDDKKLSIYINGIYLTEDEDYTIDRTVSPNQITFEEVWEDTDLCTIVWVKGNVIEGGDNNNKLVSLSHLDSDILAILNATAYISDTDITDPWPTVLTIDGSKVKAIGQEALTDGQKKVVKMPYIIDADNKILGTGVVTNYDQTSDKFTIVLTKYNQGTGSVDNASLATKEDIDKLFENNPDIDISNSTLATKEDIDNLFKNNDGDIDTSGSSLATKEDIDNLFGNINDGDIGNPSDNDVYATKEDIDGLFNNIGDSIDVGSSSLASKEDIDKLFNQGG